MTTPTSENRPDPTVRCDRPDHTHRSLDEARACYRSGAADADPWLTQTIGEADPALVASLPR